MNLKRLKKFIGILSMFITACSGISTAMDAWSKIKNYLGESWGLVLIVVSIIAAIYFLIIAVLFMIRLTGNIFLPCHHLGIKAICSPEFSPVLWKLPIGTQGLASNRIKPYLKNGKKFRFLQFVGLGLLHDISKSLVDFLVRKDAEAIIIICNPESDIARELSDIEDSANATSDRAEKLRGEVTQLIGYLQEIINAVHRRTSDIGKEHGRLTFGFCKTHFRNAIVTCDDFGWLTTTTPPIRNINAVSLELTGKNGDVSGSNENPLILAQVNYHIDSVKRQIDTIEWMDKDKLNLAAEIEKKYGLKF